MPDFEFEYTLTERTRRRITVEAETFEDALNQVQDYEVDFGDSYEFCSLDWTVDDVEEVKADG